MVCPGSGVVVAIPSTPANGRLTYQGNHRNREQSLSLKQGTSPDGRSLTTLWAREQGRWIRWSHKQAEAAENAPEGIQNGTCDLLLVPFV